MCTGAKIYKLSTVQADQEYLCFKKESFDGTWSRVSLLHSPPYLIDGILKEIREILKTNAPLFLGMKAGNSNNIETEIKTTENGTTYYCYWPPDMLAKTLNALGFKPVYLFVRDKDFFGERNYFEIFAVKFA